jgi:thiamine biosynthesis lipoprotein
LALAREDVGREHLLLNPTDRTVQLLRRDMRLDLGGIAKGYALDQALAELARHGIASALVDGGGDLALGAAPPGSAGWRVHIEGAAEDSCLLERAGLATSGDAYRYFEWQGRRYSHIVDPRTGFGLTSGVSASVVAESAMRADALASAACVLGLPDGLAWIEAQVGAEARLRGPPKEGGLAPCESSGFRRRMRLPPAP